MHQQSSNEYILMYQSYAHRRHDPRHTEVAVSKYQDTESQIATNGKVTSVSVCLNDSSEVGNQQSQNDCE